MAWSRVPSFLPPATDSDLDKTNARYQHTWHAPTLGMPPARWSPLPEAAKWYLATFVLTFGGSSIAFWTGLWG